MTQTGSGSPGLRRSLTQMDYELLKHTPDLTNIPPLQRFGFAKKRINEIFEKFKVHVEEMDAFIGNSYIKEANDLHGEHLDTQNMLRQIESIVQIIDRDHMKVAFFGRTSNGKSTVINSMLRDQILPSGIGHTTNCFLSITGVDVQEPYLLRPDSPDKKNAQTIKRLSNSLSKECLDPNAIVRLYWPKTKCALIRDEVVLVDSPGIDMSPDVDGWIDTHCQDADVFVLVANSESTLMHSEKSFFKRVNAKLSQPNIFILNNRWDCSAGEDTATRDEVRSQHQDRTIEFIVDELGLMTRKETSERIFFISAKEALKIRMGQASDLAQGWEERHKEFEDFEHKFENCLSASAINTKFHSHGLRGRDIANSLNESLKKMEELSFNYRKKCEEERKRKEQQLDFVLKESEAIKHYFKKKIESVGSNVEELVSDALREEILRLSNTVDSFSYPFQKDFINKYKAELENHLEEHLGRNLMDRCHNRISKVYEEMKNEMCGRIQQLMDVQQSAAIGPSQPAIEMQSSFEPIYQIDCQSLFMGFQSQLTFQFSFGPTAMARRFLGPRYSLFLQTLGESSSPQPTPNPARSQVTQRVRSPEASVARHTTSVTGDDNVLLVLATQLLPAFNTKTAFTATAVIAGVYNLVGWRVIAATGGVYVGLYGYERLKYTERAMERKFKQQFCDYASIKLHDIVTYTGNCCSTQVQRDLSSTLSRLLTSINGGINVLKTQIATLSAELSRSKDVYDSATSKRILNDHCRDELEHFLKLFSVT